PVVDGRTGPLRRPPHRPHHPKSRGNGMTISLTRADVHVDVAPSLAGPHLLLVDDHRLLVETLQLSLTQAGFAYDLIGPIRELGADVLVLTGTTDRLELARCLEAGALGIASKANGFTAVLDQVCRAAEGQTVTPITERTQLLTDLSAHRRAEERRRAPFESLSGRERDVLRQIVEGKPAAAIAKDSYVSLATVRTQ